MWGESNNNNWVAVCTLIVEFITLILIFKGYIDAKNN